jgi:hypothetical protein
MRERSDQILKVTCLALGALLLFQFARFALRGNPLARVKVPAAPSLAAEARNPSGTKQTNAPNAPARPGPGPRLGPGTMGPGMMGPGMMGPGMMGPGMMGPGMMGPGAGAVNVPPEIRARVERITESEILGPAIRPLPMALLGIGGNHAFLRAPNGQTGLLKEGEELAGVKLLRIGTNRVLIEHLGQQKELTVFAGFGSETLLPKEKEKSQ